MIKMKKLLNERIPTLPKINMGFGEVQTYAKMMIKKSNDIIKSAKSGDMGKTKKIIKDMEELKNNLKDIKGNMVRIVFLHHRDINV